MNGTSEVMPLSAATRLIRSFASRKVASFRATRSSRRLTERGRSRPTRRETGALPIAAPPGTGLLDLRGRDVGRDDLGCEVVDRAATRPRRAPQQLERLVDRDSEPLAQDA